MLRNFRPIPRNSLGAQVMSLLGVALLSTLIIFSFSVFYFVNRTEGEAWHGRQSEAACNAAGTVSGFIQRVRDALIVVGIVDPNYLASNADGLNSLLQENTALLEIVRVDSSGHIFASAAKDKSVLANLITIPQSQWFLQARGGQTYISNVQLSAINEPYLIMAVPSADKGVVAARVRMDVLWDVVKNIQFGDSGTAYVITRAGRVVAHTNPEIVINNTTIQEQPEFRAMLSAPNNEWFGVYNNFESARVVGYTSIIPGTDWLIIAELPLREAFSATRNAIYVLGAEVFLLMAFVSWAVTRYLRFLVVNPIAQLKDGAERIGRGELNYRIGVDLKNEIGQLASAFNSMAADLEKQQDNLQNAIAYEYETKRANELARSNSMILALSKVAVLLENSSNSELILDTLGSELQKLGLSCAVATIDSSQETAIIIYVSYGFDLIRKIEKLAGISLKNYAVPKRYWPGERIFTEQGPIWYPKPREFIRRMFPSLSEFIANQAWKLLGIRAEGQICILPLRVAENLIGAMPIWGADLQQADNPVLAVFASQVAGILQNAITHENETRRANELARSNTMILALSKVSAQLESSSNPVKIFETVKKELKKIGIDSMIGLLDDDKQNLRVRYISVRQEVIRWAEKTTGHFLNELSIPRRLWPTEKVVTEKTPYWDPNLMKGTLNMFPIIPERLHKTALNMAGINLNDAICYLPLANEQDVIGILAVWGAGLEQNDTSALSILASQVATAIRNSQLYEIEVRQSREKEVLLKEIHHRVKNNLQIISSLLNLQANQITDPRTLQVLQDSQTRVRSMALIHEKLYQSQSLARIEFGEYVKSLASDLFRSYQRNFTGIQLNVQADDVSLDLEHAIPCGLILNELMTNALKYAFPDDGNGTIWVELRANPGRLLSLRVADDGVGIPTGLDIRKTKSLGLQLVNSLVAQLDGKLEVEHLHGTEFKISFGY